MGTECISAARTDDYDGMPLIPPGFELFSLQTTSLELNTSADGVTLPTDECAPCTSDSKVCRTSRRNRPSVDYSQFDNSSDDECDRERPDQMALPNRRLPKGVIRGCADCKSCQKVIARWNPDHARRPVLDEAPAFYPTEEEFNDTLNYIESIRPVAESYGICRIIPPSSWKPPCLLREKSAWENSKFATRVQKVDKLQNRKPLKKVGRKRRKLSEEDKGINQIELRQKYDRFGFEPGPDMTMEEFQKYADDFTSQYFQVTSTAAAEPSVESIEGEYWRVVERPTEEIEVIYGADIETGSFGSGFPKACSTASSVSENEYTKSGWNLNNFPRLPGSLLCFENGDISGVLVPWLYVGMCFSSFCWHVEDHHLYSMNYLHWGAPKVWYGVPGKEALNLEAVMKRNLPHLFEEQPDLLHNLVTQFSPSTLKSEGVSVYRCIQNEGEFVITFPRAYHSGFNSGFNCAEAVNVAPVDWLPHGQNAVELYRDQGRKISVSHDKLLLGAAREAVRAQWEYSFLKKNTTNNTWRKFCGVDGVLTKALKARIELELGQRESLSCSSYKKMGVEFDDTDKECALCHYDLHLSAAYCSCDPERFACLLHITKLCSCDMSAKVFLSRFDISELNMLAEALGGKLSFVHKWAKSFLGLSLNSYVKKEKQENCCTREAVISEPACYDRKNSSLSGSKPSLVDRPSVGECTLENKVSSSSIVQGQLNSLNLERTNSNPTPLEPCSEFKSSNMLLINVESSILSRDECNGTSNYNLVTSSEVKDLAFGINNSMPVATKLDNESSMLRKEEINCEVSTSASMQTSGNDSTSSCTNQVVVPLKANTSRNTEAIRTLPADSSPEQLAMTSQHISAVQPLCDNGISAETVVLSLPCSSDEKLKNNLVRWKLDMVSESTMSSLQNFDPGLPFCMDNKQDSTCNLQKGPRLANVVRRVKRLVEPLEYGTILAGKLWSTQQAIFPKGYRSRVKYLSVVDPLQMCYYICQIMDAGLQGPIFMVTLEHCPSEVFIHTSAVSCWNMVRERLNLEIRRLHNMGRKNLPALQPPGSVDGIEMFGFSSPSIMQVIESLDRDRISEEYWKARPKAPTQVNAIVDDDDNRKRDCTTVLRGLIRKASMEEIKVLRSVMTDAIPGDRKLELVQLLDQEIQKQH